MNCQEFIRFLEAMPLGERTPAQMETLHAHGRQCHACTQRLLTASKVEHDLSQLALINPSADLSANVMRRVTAAPSVLPAPATTRTNGLFWWVAGAMVAMTTLAAIAVCSNQTGLMAWLKQLVIPHLSPQIAPSLRHLLAAGPGRWVLVLAALLVGIALLAQREEPLPTREFQA
jgi:hypothetical protein